jgi:hypothetical protein
MTKKEVDRELEEIYKEMASWPRISKELGYKIPQDELSRRKLFLIAREQLYRLEESKESRDRKAESLHEEIYKVAKVTLGLY